ncbi:hypothetical protein ANN_25397 [Periplaneta americana]|uniref:Uncharacterized protein n=1 Tax=Periplaneta americana TaxID=6978 RepID=A0ABQ8S1F6_PERAM|nr:hypothetical protein ANN_25397 [Periplaneta americana]
MNDVIDNPADSEVRSVIRFLNARYLKPAEIYRQLKEVYGDTVMNERNCIIIAESRPTSHSAECAPSIMAVDIGYTSTYMPNLESGHKGNIEGGGFDPVLWIEFGVAQWSERLSINANLNQTNRTRATPGIQARFALTVIIHRIDFHQLAAPNLANSAVLKMLEEEERQRGGKGEHVELLYRRPKSRFFDSRLDDKSFSTE